jgi:hypothetical protein
MAQYLTGLYLIPITHQAHSLHLELETLVATNVAQQLLARRLDFTLGERAFNGL